VSQAEYHEKRIIGHVQKGAENDDDNEYKKSEGQGRVLQRPKRERGRPPEAPSRLYLAHVISDLKLDLDY
jgi:hypothetical protein